MASFYAKYIKLVHTSGDMLALAASVYLGLNYAEESASPFQYPFIGALAAWLICTSLLGSYTIYRVTRRLTAVTTVLKALVLYIVLVEACLNLSGVEEISREQLLLHYGVLGLAVVGWRLTVTTALREYRRRGFNLRKVVVAGHNEMARELESFFQQHPEFGYTYLGYFSDVQPNLPGYRGGIGDLLEFVQHNEVDEIYCCPNELPQEVTTELLEFADDHMLRVKFLPDPYSFAQQNLKIDLYDILPVLLVRSIPLDDAVNKVIKRAFDIAFSLTVIVLLLSWLLPLLALLIKLNSRGPVFFRQVRSGIDNKQFHCLKLRTMYVNKDSNSLLARRGDSRITPIGAFLRKTSLDELPQFFNVLFGQMSIVGPRPHMLKADEEYAMVAEKYKVRHFVKPGITGLSQVRGYRGDTTEAYQIRGRVRLDIFYLENWTFWMDLKIIYYTIYNVVKGDKHAF